MPIVVKCLRCSADCKTGVPAKDSRPFRHAAERGLCANCMVTCFLLSVEGIRDNIQKNGPEILLSGGDFHRAIVDQFAAVLKAGNSQMRPDEIDWIEVVGNWGLPFPKIKGCQPELF